LARIDHADTSLALACERAFLGVLDGSCKTPIGGYAEVTGDLIHFRGLLAHLDGNPYVDYETRGLRADAIEIGTRAARFIKSEGHPSLFE
jgi:hydroxymethylbilane synthase